MKFNKNMIIKIYLAVLLYAYFSFDVYGTDNVPSFSPNFGPENEKVMQQQFPLQVYYNDERALMKPCKHRPEYHANEWVNILKLRLIQPSPSWNTSPSNTDLVSRSLKDGDYQDSKSRRSGFDLDSDYILHPLLNVFVDRNEDFIDDHDSELRKENQEVRDHVSDLCENCKNKLSIAKTGQKNDQKISNNTFSFDTDTAASHKTQGTKNSTSIDSPEKTQPFKNYIIVEPKSPKQNNMLEQSRRFLHNDDDHRINLPPKNLHENLGNHEHINNEPFQSANNYDPMVKPPFGSNINNEKDEIPDPTKGVGISRLSETKVLLSGSSRVCYACTSASNLSCKIPDRQTTVKYCRKGHNACVTKTFEIENSMVVIRDCASSCNGTKTPSITPKYKSCVICHSDLCNDTNGAYSINSHNLIVCLIVISFIRATF